MRTRCTGHALNRTMGRHGVRHFSFRMHRTTRAQLPMISMSSAPVVSIQVPVPAFHSRFRTSGRNQNRLVPLLSTLVLAMLVSFDCHSRRLCLA